MPSTLPTESAWGKEVDNFGLGPYDGTSDESTLKGEDDESREPLGESLPDGGAKENPPIEYYLSYPQEQTVWNKHSTGSLPGDLDRPPRGGNPSADVFVDVLPTSGLGNDGDENGMSDDEEGPALDRGAGGGHAELPDGDLPAARSDYYDRTVYGSRSFDWIAPYEDSGAYAGDDDGSGLPGPAKNDVSMDDFLGALGNAWQGFVYEDISNPYGFPSEDFSENSDFWKSNDGSVGETLANDDTSITFFGSGIAMRTATDIKLVIGLTKDFVKEYGKKNIVRRHVLSFLQDKGLPQYLASDVVRCLKHQHNVVIPDVMDTFPLAKTASHMAKTASADLGSAYRSIATLQIRHSDDPETSSVLRRCSSILSGIMADLDRNSVVQSIVDPGEGHLP